MLVGYSLEATSSRPIHVAYLPFVNAPHLGTSKSKSSAMGKFMSMSRSTRVGGIFLLLVNLSFVVQVSQAQPSQAGFLNVDCGSETSHIDQMTTIQWQPDASFISTGYNAQVQSSNLTDKFSELKSLRFFNDTRMAKHCYSLPVTDNSTYSIRVEFYYGTSDVAGIDAAPTFQLALDGTVVANVTTSRSFGYFFDYIYLSQGNVTFLCLLRDESQAVPFISAISLRPAVMYRRFADYLAANKYIQASRRLNFGGTERVRFPTDVHDRYWTPVGPNSSYLQNNTTPVQILSTTHKMNLSDYGTLVPEVVLQTAVTVQGNFTIELGQNLASAHLILHFAELDNHTSNVSRKFMVHVPSVTLDAYVNPFNFSLSPYKPMAWSFRNVSFSSDDKIVFYPKPRSRLGPLLNALELYSIVDKTTYTTSAQDVKAIEAIKEIMNLTEWAGDPCLPVPHAWLSCTPPDATLQQLRVDQLSLSGYNLQGTIPNSTLALLDVTSKLSLDNNAFTGTFPDLSSMTNLTQLHLHDNQLSGPLPDWLATMRNLQELSIQDNNFSGIIPAQLLAGNSMNFTYRPGNPLLIEQGSTSNTTQGSTGTKPVVHVAAYIFVTVMILEILYM